MKFLLFFFSLHLFQKVAIESKTLKAAKNQDNRIIGGTVVKYITSFLFVASLVRYNGWWPGTVCGASIIAKFWVVTAAHCFDNLSYHTHFILHYNSTKWDDGDHRLVNKWYIHELYGLDSRRDYDVAVAYVVTSFSKKFFITLVPSNYQYITNSTAIALGWGKTRNVEKYSTKALFYVGIKLQDWNGCKKYQARFNVKISERMFCAGDLGRAACHEDSGEPVYQYSNNKRILIGLVSGSSPHCAESKYSAVYTKLALVSDWIKNRTRMNPKGSSRKKHHRKPC